MIKKILVVCSIFTLYLFGSHDVSLKLNNENLILGTNYNFYNSYNSNYYLEGNIQGKTKEGLNEVEFLFKILSQHNLYRFGLGLNANYLKLKNNKDIFSFPIGTHFSYNLEKIGFNLNLNYAPKILCLGSQKNISSILSAKIETYYNIIENGDILIGYKNNFIFMNKEKNKTVNETAYLGLRFYF